MVSAGNRRLVPLDFELHVNDLFGWSMVSTGKIVSDGFPLQIGCESRHRIFFAVEICDGYAESGNDLPVS